MPDWDYVKDYPIWMKRDRGIKQENPLRINYLKAKGRLKELLSKTLAKS
jgi:hypothetical protein